METFTDQAGRTWNLPINSATIERVRNEIHVDLYEYGMHNESEDVRQVLQFQVRGDPILLTRILFSLVRPQADALEIPYDKFCEDLTGQALWDAIAPLETAIVNFTPNPDQRAAIEATIRKMASMLDKTLAIARAQTETTIADRRIDAAHERELRQLAAQCGKMLDSLESETQAPTPTAS